MSESVKAIVRCRPLNEREIDANVDIVVSVDPLERQITLSQSSMMLYSLLSCTITLFNYVIIDI